MTTDTMTDHELEFVRDYNVTLERLWAAVTQPAEVIKWFGPTESRVESADMNFSRLGPWSVVMVGLESGKTFKNTGVVTHYRPPEGGSEGSVGFTWAWHDDDDVRGPDSHVIFEVSQHGETARFRLIHRTLPNEAYAQQHNKGWLSCIERLGEFISA